MNNYKDFFKGKTCTVLGLGLLGRGVGDVRFLATHCDHVTVTDLKTEADLWPSKNRLSEFENISYRLGEHVTSDFEGIDFVIKGAGVPVNSPYIEHARNMGVDVYMSTALFAQLAKLPVIGVTGTRGKTSTSRMIYEILSKSGKAPLLGGNIRGMSTLEQLDNLNMFDCCVLELDSWQLQGFGDLNISPEISVFTNFFDDHLNYYDGNRELYFSDKANIFRHQKPNDVFVTTLDVKERIKKADIPGRLALAGPLPTLFDIGGFVGAHNYQNAGLARVAALAFGIGEQQITDALSQVQPDEGRLQYISEKDGIKVYNDSNATTQEATLAALAAFEANQLILIWGGADKDLDMSDLISEVNSKALRHIMLPGTGTDKILNELSNGPIMVVATMQEAVQKSFAIARRGDNIVLSPGFASFGLFKNEYDRSDQFKESVNVALSN